MYELLVGWRFTRAAGRKQPARRHFGSFISAIAIAGVVLGVAALIVVLSVVNGFERDFRAGVLGVTAHVQASGFDGTLSAAEWPRISAAAERLPGVLATAPYVNAQALFSNAAEVRGALVRGVLPEREARVADLAGRLQGAGLDALRPGERNVILGAELARRLGVKPGDAVQLVVPRTADSAQALPKVEIVHVAGTFSVGMHDFDSALALMHLRDAQALFDLDGRVSGVRLRLADPLAARRTAAALAQSEPRIGVSDWMRANANLFHAVQTSKTMVVLVVSLLIGIAAFNIVASLVMAVTEKRADIAILRTLGAPPAAIQRIFIVQGAVIGAVGTAAGVVLGVLVAANLPAFADWVEKTTGFKPIAPEVYHISRLPAELRVEDVVLTAIVALALCFLATLYPSWRAARVRPAEALRHE